MSVGTGFLNNPRSAEEDRLKIRRENAEFAVLNGAGVQKESLSFMPRPTGMPVPLAHDVVTLRLKRVVDHRFVVAVRKEDSKPAEFNFAGQTVEASADRLERFLQALFVAVVAIAADNVQLEAAKELYRSPILHVAR